MIRNKTAIVAVVLYPALAMASDDPFITERPGFSTSPQTLPDGLVQAEVGIDLDPDSDLWSLPVSLVRFGVSKRVELQLGWGGVTLVPSADDSVNDLFVNSKFAVWEQSGLIPNIGLLVGASVPVDDDRALGDSQITGGFLWSYDVDGRFGLFGTATLISSELDGDGDATFTNAVGISKGLTSRVGSFIEVFSSFNDETGDGHVIDFGFTYLAQAELQFDISAGVAIDGPAASDFISVGASWRW